jgi:hypothetical protein
MALRGSLHEFELAEIFQLISRDAKTGQLVLSHHEKEAFVIFSQGAVVAAGTNEHNLQTLLFRYLMSVKRYSEEELSELLQVCHGEMGQFSQELVNRNYLPASELSQFARMGIEDLACSLFLWDQGNYRFDSLDGIREYVIGGVTFPVDAITMEAMRRTDEWKRIRQHISDETVFSIVRKPQALPSPASPVSDVSGYILSFVNGTTTVGGICEGSILLPYRVYETLFGLWQESVVAPLAVSRPQEKQLASAMGKPAPNIMAAVVSVVVVLMWACALFSLSHLGLIPAFRNATIARQLAVGEVKAEWNAQKETIASLQYRALTGNPSPDAAALVKEGLLCREDLGPRAWRKPLGPAAK